MPHPMNRFFYVVAGHGKLKTILQFAGSSSRKLFLQQAAQRGTEARAIDRTEWHLLAVARTPQRVATWDAFNKVFVFGEPFDALAHKRALLRTEGGEWASPVPA